MKYEIRATSPGETLGGLADENPANFIYPNLPAIEGTWAHDGSRFTLALDDPPLDSWAQTPVVTTGPRASGRVYLQIATDTSMHIEYLVELMEGREIGAEEHPFESTEIAAALRRWFESNSKGVYHWVQSHAGELR